MLGRRICVALPDTVLEERSSLRDKTVKLGMIARSCSIFGVDAIQIFRDPEGRGKGDSGLMMSILQYVETPQYLRKSLFELYESLKYVGLLPPLRIPSHKLAVPIEGLRVGEIREGVVLPDGQNADVGLERSLKLKGKVSPGKRVTVRVTGLSPLEGSTVDRGEVKEYWGYSVEVKSIKETLADTRYPLKIATSRRGDSLSDVFGTLEERVSKASALMLLFGSPTRGLSEILGRNIREKVDFVVNLFSEQHVFTVRTEEAIPAGLYLIQLLSGMRGKTKV